MDKPIELYASFDDGKLVIERKDAQPIAMISRDEENDTAVEIVEYGSSGNAVKALQALLNCHDQHLEVDGSFGPLTQTALIIFQDQKKIPATGECDALTWQALIRS